MFNTFGSIASILGFLISVAIYLKIRENRKFYLGKRYTEINKKRISDIIAISDEKKKCTGSVKKEIESIVSLYKQTRLPLFRKKRERKIVSCLNFMVNAV